MRNMSSIMNALYFLSEWFVRFTFVNLVWFVLNIPLTIVTLNFILSETERIISKYDGFVWSSSGLDHEERTFEKHQTIFQVFQEGLFPFLIGWRSLDHHLARVGRRLHLF